MDNNSTETIQDLRILTFFREIASLFSLFVIVIGILAEFGWQFDIDFIRNFQPGYIFMNPLTALCFILIGLSIQIILQKKMHKFIWLAQLAGIIVFVVGFASLGAIIFGFDTHIDQLLFGSKLFGNRIAPNTAFNFVFIGISLFLLTKDKYYKLINILCFLVNLISLLAILGYVYSVQNLYGVLAQVPMAFNTAIAFYITSLAMLLIRSDRGFMTVISSNFSGSKISRILLPSILIIPSVLGKVILWAQDSGLINTRFGFAIFNVFLVSIFFVLMCWITIKLNKIDLRRQQKVTQIMELKEEQLKHDVELQENENDFILVASHQLLTPLALMKGYTSMLLSGKVGKIDTEAQKYLQETLYSSERMSSLVKSLLTTSRIESENVKMVSANFDMDELSRSVAFDSKQKLQGKKLALELPSPKKLMVFADKEQTKEVLINVIDNAIKYSKKGAIAITYGKTDTMGIVHIKDTGIGINQKDLPHIFEKFYSSENWLQTQSESHGLGLYIAKLLLTVMGGTISAESTVGKGSTFSIALPLSKNV